MQEQSIKILSTMPITALSVKQAAMDNILIDCNNFIAIRPVNNTAVINQIKTYTGKQLTALFTSANAVNVVSTYFSQRPAWQIFCLSGKTKTALLEHFRDKQIIASAPHAAALIPKIMAAKPSGECVFFCGNKHINTLPDAFLEEGIPLTELVVYKTISSPQKVNKSYDGLLFFSPSGVESFFSLNTVDDRTVCFAIGDTTAKAVRKFTGNPVITAGFPDKENMIQEVQKYFKRK